MKLPKIKPVEANNHREIVGKVKSITLSKVTGIDLGLFHFAIESNGRKTANPRFVKRAEKNLRRKQRQLSRKAKGSANRAKTRLLVAKCHEKVANARADFQHKLSRTLVDENQAVIIETLKSTNMMKSRKLAKHIADASWHSFVFKLEYKLKEQGKYLVKLNQWDASSKRAVVAVIKWKKCPYRFVSGIVHQAALQT
ncbi:transposase [Vibrio sp. L3-7]|uniref:RNA-guided endonuclease InsQ/TnpB family protein n=1 Tax=Vibrio sp. L3-7 TaxID=2912253 RepID=UPI0030DA42DF